MSEPSAPAPLYVDTFRIDLGANGVAIITFGSPVSSFADRAPTLRPSVAVAMTENKLAELAETLNQRSKKPAVLKLKPKTERAAGDGSA